MTLSEILQIVQLAAMLFVFPLINSLRNLEKTVNLLELTLHKEFQTRKDAGLAMDYVNEQLSLKQNRRR